MRITHFASATALGALLTLGLGGAVHAQGVPAEQPPSSFSGDQYVDSAGCVFIRAGVGGATEWVPRVGRDRNQICGQRPSVAGAAAQPQAPTVTERDNVVVIGGATTATQPRVTTRPAAPATPTVQVVPQTPRTVTVAPVQQVPATPRVVANPDGTTCPGMTGLTAQYLSGPGVRCGPQAVHPGDAARGIEPGAALIAPVPITVPEGYRVAFDDGRLNPNRGVGTALGAAQMALVWTNTVPRRLVNSVTGEDVTDQYPQVIARLVAAEGASDPTPELNVDVSSRSEPPAAIARPEPQQQVAAAPTIRVPADHRNILAATYTTRSEADRAYARLAASGLPARLGQINRASGTVYAVVAGPFSSTQAVVDGLRAAHSAGFTGAVTRR